MKRTRTVLLPAFFLLVPGLRAGAAPPVLRWREIESASTERPEPRRGGAAIHDPIGGRLVVFGGVTAAGAVNDVWTFDLRSREWRNLAISGATPAPRFGFDAVYDPVARAMVIWGGQGSRFFNDVWSLDLASGRWKEVAAPGSPRPRYGTAAVFDATARRLVTFGGFTDQGRFKDTHALSLAAGAWQDLAPQGVNPGERCLHTAALRRFDGRMVMYGGQRTGPLGDLWAYDLARNAWTELTPPDSPPGRLLASSYVDALSRFVLFGGATNDGAVSETWSFDFDSGSWTRQQTLGAPRARSAAMSAYVEDENRFVVFGGIGSELLGDLWELVAESPGPEPVASWLLPAAASAPGAGGAFFTTRLDVVNTGAASATVTLKLLGHDVDGRSGEERTFAIAAGATATFPDLLADVFGATDTYGAVRIISTSASLVAVSQTSTPGPSGGTYGQSVATIAEPDWIRPGAARTIAGLREDEAFRTNLVLANATASTLDVDVALVGPSGASLGSTRVALPPLGMTQLPRVARLLGAAGGLPVGRLVLSTPTAGGAFTAYAAVIDEVTNDPRTLLPR